jgi:hypothetical protein
LHPFWKLKKKAYYCPEGEQMVNGDFETGDATGWTLAEGEIQTVIVHSGVYAARVYPAGGRKLWQDLAAPLRVECVDTFGAWVRKGSGAIITITVDYAIGEATTYTVTCTGDWLYVDLKPDLVAGRDIIRVTFLNGIVGHLYVDDVSLISAG